MTAASLRNNVVNLLKRKKKFPEISMALIRTISSSSLWPSLRSSSPDQSLGQDWALCVQAGLRGAAVTEHGSRTEAAEGGRPAV